MNRLLALSLALNLLLAGLWLWRQGHPAPVPRPPRGSIGEPATRADTRPPPRTATAGVPPTPWAALESRDLRQFLANLRATGCPESTLRDLIVFRVGRHYRERLVAAAEGPARAWDFTRDRTARSAWEEQREHAELRDQMQTELEDLLGPDVANYRLNLLGWEPPKTPDFLPLAKRQQVRELETRHRWATWELTVNGLSGQLDTEAAAQLATAQREHREALARVLSPAEFEEYLLRESPAAQFVRERLPAARSEAEFRAIVRIADELELDPRLGNDAAARYGQEPLDPELARTEAERLAELDRQLKGLLGEERLAEQAAAEQAAAEQERAREREQQEEADRARLATLAAAVGVDGDAVDRFMAQLKAQQAGLEQRFSELEKTLTGTPEEKQRQMATAVMAELEQLAVAAMGEKGRDFVKRLREEQR